MSLNNSEREIIENVIRRLDSHTNTRMDPRMKTHLDEIQLYLRTWVIGPLETVVDTNRRREDLEIAVRLSR